MPFWRRKSQDDSNSSSSSSASSISLPDADPQHQQQIQQQHEQQLELQLEQPIPPPDISGTSSSSEDAAAAAAAEQQQQPEASSGSPGDDNPMLQTSLTKRFKGRFHPMQMPTYDLMMQEDMMNNCGVKSAIAGVMGGALGVAFGVFTASLDTQGIDAAPMGETKPTRVVLRETWILMKEKSKSYAKGFAGMGFLYSGTECLIEKYRAKHDNWNATLAGCATGGLMAAPGGPKAMCFGCASFAAFSTAIEYFTGGH